MALIGLPGILTAISECRDGAWIVRISWNDLVLEPDWNLPLGSSPYRMQYANRPIPKRW